MSPPRSNVHGRPPPKSPPRSNDDDTVLGRPSRKSPRRHHRPQEASDATDTRQLSHSRGEEIMLKKIGGLEADLNTANEKIASLQNANPRHQLSVLQTKCNSIEEELVEIGSKLDAPGLLSDEEITDSNKEISSFGLRIEKLNIECNSLGTDVDSEMANLLSVRTGVGKSSLEIENLQSTLKDLRIKCDDAANRKMAASAADDYSRTHQQNIDSTGELFLAMSKAPVVTIGGNLPKLSIGRTIDLGGKKATILEGKRKIWDRSSLQCLVGRRSVGGVCPQNSKSHRKPCG